MLRLGLQGPLLFLRHAVQLQRGIFLSLIHIYASQQEMTPVLEISSSMDIGEHPAGALGTVAVFTNADQIRLYRNDRCV